MNTIWSFSIVGKTDSLALLCWSSWYHSKQEYWYYVSKWRFINYLLITCNNKPSVYNILGTVLFLQLDTQENPLLHPITAFSPKRVPEINHVIFVSRSLLSCVMSELSSRVVKISQKAIGTFAKILELLSKERCPG